MLLTIRFTVPSTSFQAVADPSGPHQTGSGDRLWFQTSTGWPTMLICVMAGRLLGGGICGGGGGGADAVTVTDAIADFVVSATLVAVMLTGVSALTDGAVNNPELEIDPWLVVQVTAVLPVPVTVAENCCVAPDATVALLGETDTATVGGGGGGGGGAPERPSVISKSHPVG